MCLQIIYLIYMYKENLALNTLQWLICHETKQNQTETLLPVIFYVFFASYFSATFSGKKLWKCVNCVWKLQSNNTLAFFDLSQKLK